MNKNKIRMEELPPLDISEKGRKDGQPISLDRRLFVQMLSYGGCKDTGQLVEALKEHNIEGVLYADINDPQAVGLLTFNEDPDYFVTEIRQFINNSPFGELTPKPEYTMIGRTYAIGYEADLEDVLVNRPRKRMLDPKWGWAIWYPLQRSKGFEILPKNEQMAMLKEHGDIGFAFGRAGYAADIRLSCHGLDKNDNDFLIGILSKELYPASAVVQAMRKTQQTAVHLVSLGPFFVGKAIWKSGNK